MARLRTSANSRQRHAPGRLAVTRAEAARSLGVSINSFERHVQPELRIVRRGKLRLIPVRENRALVGGKRGVDVGAP
jgi:hypothetical protein